MFKVLHVHFLLWLHNQKHGLNVILLLQLICLSAGLATISLVAYVESVILPPLAPLDILLPQFEVA